MVTTMETWLLADRGTFIACFPDMNANALPPDTDLENRSKPDVSAALRSATQSSSKGRYHKGNHSFDLLGRVEPEELKSRLLPGRPSERGAHGARKTTSAGPLCSCR